MTGLIYASTWDVPRLQKIAASRKEQVLGADSTGVTARVPDVHPGDVMETEIEGIGTMRNTMVAA